MLGETATASPSARHSSEALVLGTPPHFDPEAAATELQNLYAVLMQAPAMIAVARGRDLVYEFANPLFLKVVGKTESIIGKPLLEVMPELEGQPILDILYKAYDTGEPYIGTEVLVKLDHDNDGNPQDLYFNFVYQPLKNALGEVEGILTHAVEVTEQVRAKHAAEEKEARYRTLFNSIDEGFCIIDVLFDAKGKPYDYRFLEINQIFEEQTGMRAVEGKTVLELAPNLEKFWIETYGKVAMTRKPVRFTNGSEALGRWFDVYATPVGGQDTHQVAVLFKDITQRKQAEDALKVQLEITNAITDNTTVALFLIDEEGVVTFMNPAAVQLTGYLSEEAVGRSIHGLIHYARADGTAYPEDECQVLQAFKAHMSHWTSEDMYFRKDGSQFQAVVTATPLHENLKPRGTVVELRDVTEERLVAKEVADREAQLRFMAESMPQKVFTATPDGDVDYFNPQWMEYTGLSFEQIREWGWLQFIHPDDVEENVRAWKYSIATGEPFELEHRFRRYDGTYHWHISRAHAMRDQQGKIIKWIGSNTDVEAVKKTLSRKKQLEDITESLKEQRKQLIALNRAKDEFISLASHQLRTPATGVKQYLGMVLDGFAGDVTDTQRHMLDQAYLSNEREITIINDLLKVAQVDAGRVRLVKKPADMRQLIERVLADQRSKFDERKQDVVFQCKHPAVVVGMDEDRMHMVLENIIDNASKYTPSGKRICVSLDISRYEVTLSVEDEGVGIDEHEMDKLFRKFSRLDNPLSVTVGGTGLGLYWAKKIVDLHDGTIEVESEVGTGTTFRITIPVD